MRDEHLPEDLLSVDTVYNVCRYLVDNPIMFMGLSMSALIMSICLYVNNKEGK